jgi:mono/diheme cytochrome c family protein
MFSKAKPHGASVSWWRAGIVIPALVAALIATAAQAQDETTVKAGLEIWKGSGCSDCHGAFANGDKERDEAPTGANLRTSRLDAAALKETIRCGRPGAEMPSFDEGAYTVRACGGRPLGPAPDNLYPAPRTLTPAEIDTLIVYLRARVVGHPRITRTDCLYYYYDSDESMCEDYK